LFDREAAALTRESIARSELEQHERKREVSRLRDVACELESAAMDAGYVGYPFGEEVL
jgi:hypothetical protein